MKRIAQFLMLILTLSVGLWMWGLRYNFTESLPKGFYLLKREFSLLENKRSIVYFCPPDSEVFQQALERGYLMRGVCPGGFAPLIKQLVAVPGDVIAVQREGVSVNGIRLENSESQLTDRQGRQMTKAESVRLGADQVWVMSTYNPRSFDSRYFGPIDVSLIQGHVEPLLTWND